MDDYVEGGAFDPSHIAQLILRVNDSQTPPLAALSNLDGQPGDELVLTIPRYGLAVMGISPQPGPDPAASMAPGRSASSVK